MTEVAGLCVACAFSASAEILPPPLNCRNCVAVSHASEKLGDDLIRYDAGWKIEISLVCVYIFESLAR